MLEHYPLHPLYEDKDVRAIFSPMNCEGLNEGAQQMVGHEFVWRHIDYAGNMPLWMPADMEDIDAYFEVAGVPRPDTAVLWILEEDLYIQRVEKFDA